jgi:hypothetical protein
MKRNPRSRQAVNLSQPLHKKIDLYSLAAGAAGVGMLALAPSAQAEIIYTAANLSVGRLGPVTIDLNNDGKPDMQFSGGEAVSSFGGTYGFNLARASYAPSSNAAVGKKVGRWAEALALPAGQEIGPNRPFSGGLIADRYYNVYRRSNPILRWYGQWGNQGKGLNNRYAGVRFMIDGELHYGWIRVSVSVSGPNYTGKVTGYAYETIPNKPIIAGATKESDEEKSSAALETPASGPATLGALALGAPGLSIWRRNN